MLGKMDCCGLTDIGRHRRTNEDQFLIADLNKSMRVHQTSLRLDHHTRLFGGSQGKLLLVADGLGGEAAGERASSLAVDGVTRYVLNTMDWFFRLDGEHEHEFLDELCDALRQCDRDIAAEGERIPRRRGMGTTLTMAYLIWPGLYVVHVGDSRCYLFRRRELRQLTRDHTLAQQFVEQGALPAEEADESPLSHILWNVVGGKKDCELQTEVYRNELQIGDAVLLCTDGLSKHVPDREIARILNSAGTAETLARRLIRAANEAGGSDNITVVLARFLDNETAADWAEAETVLEEPAPAEAVSSK